MWKTPDEVERPMFDFSVYQSTDTVISILEHEGVSYTVAFGHGLISASAMCGKMNESDCRGISHTQDIDAQDRRVWNDSWQGQLFVQQCGRGTRK